jgi:hypothetical protein
MKKVIAILLLLVFFALLACAGGKIKTEKIDNRFIANGNGTVLDTKTNLTWAAKDNGNAIEWAAAKSYCENYRGGGYTDWRMPTQDELKSLYDETEFYIPGCEYNGIVLSVHLTELIHLSCTVISASDMKKSAGSTAYFHFRRGLAFSDSEPWEVIFHRALPVRSGK